ncbi:hypothetical protein JX265_000373 [Neoarthrinium moseri]|uniref:TauD/TfdA-like domain-containing protein n=1 Tax=Neoarthrinium moseri TaxID=1658444 RepID=A0A9P9WYR6_9PEZI|nr:uncharacterized protein JN550_000623 [Neoarthrinium moseri]KAI1851393.1 hypothetical protein JX266_003468 [Neoarthrinium moseri]KAI1878441.1 hypothetical protein JN550_000623 [Neoarthrinium moseri]KAI1881547.1 hypothetical protein JX265_000373 [Neoarthrinium moseri]
MGSPPISSRTTFDPVVHQDVRTKSQDEYFNFPAGSRFVAPSREMGLYLKKAFAHALKEYGVVSVELKFDDPKSHFMLELIQEMGFTPDTHSGTQGALWDITYKPEGISSLKSATGKAHSRSHGVGEFAWHTDGSYEAHPQRFFGLHVVHPDKQGGGIFRVLPAESLVSMLSPQAIDALLRTEFDIQVPEEFYKGQASNRGRLLDVDPKTGHFLLRFRADILPDPPTKDNPAANAAVAELKRLLNDPKTQGQRLPDDVFKENVMLLMDNARFLHMRTAIKDKKRLLRRIRFHGEPQTD